MSIPTTYGVATIGGYRDVSQSLTAAKYYAARRGIREVYKRANGGYVTTRASVRVNGRWVDC